MMRDRNEKRKKFFDAKLTGDLRIKEDMMTKSLIAHNPSGARSTPPPSYLRRIIVSQLSAGMTDFMSQIERWPDSNYMPQKLDYQWNQRLESYEIIAPLHRFAPDDVHVDIRRGHIIILLSRDHREADRTGSEYYCEVPIPADAQQEAAVVELSTYFVTVYLNKKRSTFKRAISAAYRLRQGFGLLLRNGWNFGRFDG